MSSFNQAIILGNLTREPERFQAGDKDGANFGMACNRKFRDASGQDREEVTFVDITAFGNTAKVVLDYCQKGNQLMVTGRLKQETWEDKNGGGKRSRIIIVADRVVLLGSKPRDDSDNQRNNYRDNRQPQQQRQQSPQPQRQPYRQQQQRSQGNYRDEIDAPQPQQQRRQESNFDPNDFDPNENL